MSEMSDHWDEAYLLGLEDGKASTGRTPTVYLASSIDQGLEDAKPQAKNMLLSEGFAVFDPGAGWDVPGLAVPNKSLQAGNLAMLREVDALFAILNRQTLSVGVVLEIYFAKRWNLPVVVYAPTLKPSWSLSYLKVDPVPDLFFAVRELKGQLADV